MASRKKKAPAAETAVGLKQKSLLFFFSKPSSHPSLQHSTARFEDDGDDSLSSTSLQDAGVNLRWSQILTGWSPSLVIESTPKESSDDKGTPKESSDDKGTPAHNKVHKLKSVMERSTPGLLSGFLNGDKSSTDVDNGADYTRYVSGKNDETEARFSLYTCKRRRSGTYSSHSCNNEKIKNTEMELLEASVNCCQTAEAQSTYQCQHDEAFTKDCNEPVEESLCPGSALRVTDKTNGGGTNSLFPSLSSRLVLQIKSSHPYASASDKDSALKPDTEYDNVKLCKSVCGPYIETSALGSAQVDTDNGTDKPGIMVVDASKVDLEAMAGTAESDNNHGSFELNTVDGHCSLATNERMSTMPSKSDPKPSFLKLRTGFGHRISAPEEVLEASLTDYEREREENILRNHHFMQKLGLATSALTTNKESVKKPKGKAVVNKLKSELLPVRRSNRLIQESTGPHRQDVCIAPVEEETLCYDDSSVLRYTCGDRVSTSASNPSQENIKHGIDKLLGFHPLLGVLQDKCLTRIYTMSAYFLSQSQRTLLAAGGHQGHIAVFGKTCYDASYLISGPSLSVDADKDGFQEPLLSWKGSSCWISGVKFLSIQARESATLLLSSANDGNLVLWDINKQQKVPQLSKLLAGLPPLKVTEALDVHSNGIFSMHEYFGHVATASKDATVGYTKITDQEIRPERSISGHHAGAIRGVNFRDASVLADCGSDGLVCVLDLRMAEPCTSSIDTADATGVNVVEWCPSQEHLLLSASKSPEISLYDIRNTKEALYKLGGHVSPKVQRCSQIYRPTFVAQGGAIVTPGQGSKALSLYSVCTGRAISRGHLGYDATMVFCDESASVLWVASRYISQLLPLWQS